MIVVKIELVSAIHESRSKEIGRMYISNEGGTEDRGDYKVYVCKRGTTEPPREMKIAARSAAPKATRLGEVKDYPRLSYNVWRLISRALRSAFPEEK